MKAYHNDPWIRAKYIARFAQHCAADAVIQGTGYFNGRGCFVGCTLEKYDHSQFPIELGWPEWLARLADALFESLPAAEAPQFGTDLLAAVPVGADLETVRVPFLLSIQRRNLERLTGNDEPYAQQCRDAIRRVIDALESGAAEGQRESAEAAAWVARWSAEDVAELTGSNTSVAHSTAESAALAAQSAAESAALAAQSAQSAQSAAALSVGSAQCLVAQSATSALLSAWASLSEALSVGSAAWYEVKAQRDTLLALIAGVTV